MDNNKYLTISQLNHYIKSQFDANTVLQRVFLKGEISNFKNHSVGHLYFTLKDENSRLNAVMFAFNAKNLKFLPKDGDKVLITGKISVYEPNGNYQIYVEQMDNDGIGNLYYAYEELKKKLSLEGLFNEEHKKKIPKFPSSIGIITAPTGAAIKDILSTIKRRFPICSTILFPSLVQGEGAKENIIRMLKEAEKHDLDVIILGRGGGSIEDLWAFNEEIVARAVYECPIPIISAVGHEIDFTICDYVADLRAPTPTGAAEIAVPNISDVISYIEQLKIRISRDINNKLASYENKLTSLKENRSLAHPMGIYEIKTEKLAYTIDKTNNLINSIISKSNNKLEIYENNYIFRNPLELIRGKDNKFNNLIEKLKILNPIAVLEKGYSIVKVNNNLVKSASDVKTKDKINIKLSKGIINAIVEGVEEDGKN